MKVVNAREQREHKERVKAVKEQHARFLETLEAQAPKPVELERHPEGEAPKEVAPNVFVMGGDYYRAEPGLVVAAAAVGPGKEWVAA